MEKQKRIQIFLFGLSFLFLILAGVMAFRVFMQPELAPINQGWKSYRVNLSQNEWKEWTNRKQRIKDNYAQISQRILVDPNTGELVMHYANPPYGANLSQLKICLDDEEETVLYQSKKILPGTLVDTASMKEKLSAGTYSCRAYFKFYTNQKKLLSEHDVVVELIVR